MRIPKRSHLRFDIVKQIVLGNVVEIKKKSCLRIKIPRSSKIDGIQDLGQCSPTIVAEEELVMRVEEDLVMCLTIRPTNSPTNGSLDQFPRTELRGRRRRRSSKQYQSYDLSTGIIRPAQQSGSAPPSREERLREN